MKQSKQPKISLETRLGLLAMQYRSATDKSEREKVSAEYTAIVNRLIKGGKWQEMPSFEDMLPDECMPRAFFKYWSIPVPNNLNGK